MNYVMSEDGSTSRDPVYICIAESQLNSVMKNLESAQGRCSRQSLEMVTTGHDLRQHIHIIRAALDHLSDRRLLSVILDNLVANAVKYTSLGQIDVDCRSEGDCLLVSVEDTGPGIACDELGRFAQSACMSQLDTIGSGMGLGLDIVHRSAAPLGHEIDVASVPGIGTCATVKVPLARSTETEPLAIGMSHHGSTRFK
jgi:signal transduction histidine kinase